MQKFSGAVVSLLLLSTLPVSLFAKGATVEIVIEGPNLTAPIEITDPKVGEFQVWDGPGVRINGIEQTEGFIINWSKSAIGPVPTGLQKYEISFYAGCRIGEGECRTSKPSLVYVVHYAYNPSIPQGFVYLPGPSDGLFKFNTAIWRGHGLEGSWRRASSAWEAFVRPLLSKAVAAPPR